MAFPFNARNKDNESLSLYTALECDFINILTGFMILANEVLYQLSQHI
jgi:hypothetical protein